MGAARIYRIWKPNGWPAARLRIGNEDAKDLADLEGAESEAPRTGTIVLGMQVKGQRPVSQLIARLTEIDGIVRVGTSEEETECE